MVTVLVDGYNAIHAIPSLAKQLDRSLDAARHALIARCRAYRARRGDVGRLYVVFDGRDEFGSGPREDLQGITVIFTRKGEEADERILSVIRAGGRGSYLVVSNDTQICNNARALGARVISAAQFDGQPAGPRARGGPSGGGRRHPAGDSKPPLPTRETDRITEDYRKHLERGGP